METHEPFDGQPIIKTAVKVVGAGDGLSEALGADGKTLKLGDEVNVVLACVVAGADLRPIDKDDPAGPLTVKYVLKAGKRATVTDADDQATAELLVAQEQRIEAAAGQDPLVQADGTLNPDAVEQDPFAEAQADEDGYVDVAPS